MHGAIIAYLVATPKLTHASSGDISWYGGRVHQELTFRCSEESPAFTMATCILEKLQRDVILDLFLVSVQGGLKYQRVVHG